MNPKKWRGWCTNCGSKPIKTNATKYCSLRCQFDFQYKQKIDQLERGEYEHCGLCRSSIVWRYLVEKLGERCARCGWSERNPSTGRIPIEIEHIDGDWKNNRPENLMLLCPNCHALTPTFRALNRGKGRAQRFGGRQTEAAGVDSKD